LASGGTAFGQTDFPQEEQAGTTMRVLPYFAVGALLAALAAAQMPGQMPGTDEAGEARAAPEAGPGTAPTDIPDIPAGEDPMRRQPDPAAGSGAAQGPAAAGEEDHRASGETVCRVERAATDTAFIVVCE
jgi:hypothetical protein